MPLIVPLQAVPSQTAQVSLNGQACTINAYQKFYGLFLDLLVSNQVIIQGVLCLNTNFIVRSLYLGFSGDLAFVDSQGSSDPSYTGLGGRFSLWYLLPSDLPATYGLSRFEP